eukprot:3087114-Rhodomonas_salina.1
MAIKAVKEQDEENLDASNSALCVNLLISFRPAAAVSTDFQSARCSAFLPPFVTFHYSRTLFSLLPPPSLGGC